MTTLLNHFVGYRSNMEKAQMQSLTNKKSDFSDSVNEAPDEERPVAWLHDQSVQYEVIHDEVRALWLKVKPQQVEYYTIPLYLHLYRPPPPRNEDD